MNKRRYTKSEHSSLIKKLGKLKSVIKHKQDWYKEYGEAMSIKASTVKKEIKRYDSLIQSIEQLETLGEVPEKM